ncbi:DUF3426 domain-containing protein [Luteimonas sp. MC1572]|uniref:DUF3426 domain-containing protein n=1 Tax=Luteimonas sp. MC1572 TaxID=2799325 RepID=UPI0018F07BF8|nr:DUF3426 domain-containing protein [Luteimonas sp. MC1572]MBJ6982308.1 DUF3426 domain-containing protein [Luteimonas sp. MC1572]QQO03577.1 DUF3426 domain-containing protein [Luteimonas sp. MC1572]
MFINCPYCRGLIATDPATDLPPPRCPRCAAQLDATRPPEQAHDVRGPDADAIEAARSGVAAAIEDAFGPARDADAELLARPAISVASLLRSGTDVAEGDVAPQDAAASTAVAAAPAPSPDLANAVKLADGEHAANAEEASLDTAGPGVLPDIADDVPTPAGDVPAQPAAADASVIAPTPARRTGKPAPSFARARRIAADVPPGRRWVMPAAIVGLTALLGVQWLLADRARLAADPAWRPVVARTCALLRCTLPPWREPAAFALLERDVRPHPQRADTLRITASFRNNAAWPQPWPEVVLTLSDVDGRPLGTRAFAPDEYLGQAPDGALIDSGAGAVIRMDVREPGRGAVAFMFDFR